MKKLPSLLRNEALKLSIAIFGVTTVLFLRRTVPVSVPSEFRA